MKELELQLSTQRFRDNSSADTDHMFGSDKSALERMSICIKT